MNTFKAVKFGYEPTPESNALLEVFRMMVSHAIAIALEENTSGRIKLHDRIYHEFSERYGLVTP